MLQDERVDPEVAHKLTRLVERVLNVVQLLPLLVNQVLNFTNPLHVALKNVLVPDALLRLRNQLGGVVRKHSLRSLIHPGDDHREELNKRGVQRHRYFQTVPEAALDDRLCEWDFLLVTLLIELFVVPSDSLFALVKNVHFEISKLLLALLAFEAVTDAHARPHELTVVNYLCNNNTVHF